MAIKAIHLDNRVLKTPTTGGELKNLQSTTNLKEYIESIISAQPTEFFADGTAAAPSITFQGDSDTGIFLGGNNILGFSVNGTKVLDVRTAQVTSIGNFVLQNYNIILGTSTGTKIGTATSQKLAFWNATPIVQPTTAVTAAAFVANSSGISDDTATFGGYTVGQVVAALQAVGILA